MTPAELIDLFDRTPFIPYDVRTSDGRVYRVDHSEFVMRSRDASSMYFKTDDDRLVRIDTHHIVAVEDVNSPAFPRATSE